MSQHYYLTNLNIKIVERLEKEMKGVVPFRQNSLSVPWRSKKKKNTGHWKFREQRNIFPTLDAGSAPDGKKRNSSAAFSHFLPPDSDSSGLNGL